MSVTLEQIDELRKRANVSYNDAREALEASNGDVLEALVYLENHKKVDTKTYSTITEKAKKLIKKGNETSFIIKKRDKIVINIPVTIAVGITVIAPHISAIGVGLSLVTGHKIKFEGKNGEDMKINKTMDQVSKTVDNIKDSIIEKKEKDNTIIE